MKVGLEVHQQLETGKLFCACPSELSEVVQGEFVRRLRAAGGEGHAVDAAAQDQAARGLRYRYQRTVADCLVEMDEEPPHAINPRALEAALILARSLGARVVDEIEVMRKIVVDGSNTSGFQRTALVAQDGELEVAGRRVSILSICLEEDAGRKVAERPGEITYRLDRLGIPLIEIATGPEIDSPEFARTVAEEIGSLLRATGKVRRGIGTIREDLNVSVEGGRRIEIKGVQELRRLAQYVEHESDRQRTLLDVKARLAERPVPSALPPAVDVSSLLGEVREGPAGEALRQGGVVLALGLPGFAGLLKSPPGTQERLGRELADQARSVGLRGLLHSDELPGPEVPASAVAAVRARLGLGERDAFVLVADRDRERAASAIERIGRRALSALDGIPSETRDPLPDGRTRYSRPLPGRDRMYPETDVPPIRVDPAWLAEIDRHLPERPGVTRQRLGAQYAIGAESVRQIVAGGLTGPFEALAQRGHAPARVARLLTQDLPAADPDGSWEWSVELLDGVLKAQSDGRIAKEGFPKVLGALVAGAPDVEAALERSGLATLSLEELRTLAQRIVTANASLLAARGEAAFSPLMGDLMREVRGRRDGQEVAAALREAIAARGASSAP